MSSILHAPLAMFALLMLGDERTLLTASSTNNKQATDSRLVGKLASMFFALAPVASFRSSRPGGVLPPTVKQSRVNRRSSEPEMIRQRLVSLTRSLRLHASSDEATPLRKTFYGLRRRLGKDHPDAIVALSAYAMKIADLGRPADAVSLMYEVYKRRDRILGKEHPDTLEALNNYALLLNSCGRQVEAEPIMRAALPVRRRVLGRYKRKTIAALNDYADTLGDLGRHSEAQPLNEYVADRSYQLLGPDDPETTRALRNFAGRDYEKLQTELKAKDAIKDAISKFPQEEPNWNIFADDFKVIDQTDVELDCLENFKRTSQVLNSVRDALAAQVEVVFLDEHGQNEHGVFEPFVEARWRVEFRLPLGLKEIPLEVEADTRFHITGDKADYLKISTLLLNGRSIQLSPKIELSRDFGANLKNISEWFINIIQLKFFESLGMLRT